MKFGDVLKIALHNLWNNKSRTVLTVIIVTIVSSLIMALCLMGIAFVQNQVDVSKIVFEAEGTTYRASYRFDKMSEYESVHKPYTQEEVDWINQTVEEYKHVVDTVSYQLGYDSNFSRNPWQYYFTTTPAEMLENGTYQQISNAVQQNGIYFDLLSVRFADLGMYHLAKDGIIKEGRIWSKADRNTGNVWVGSDYVRTLQNQYQITLNLGDKFSICAIRGNDVRVAEITVCGIFDSGLVKKSSWGTAPPVIYDGTFFMASFQGAYIVHSVDMFYRPPQTNYDYNAVYDEMEALTARLNEGVRTYIDDDGNEAKSCECSYIEDMRLTILLGTIIMAVVIFLALLILLLSVGSVANTIIISVDKNRKFIGLMKAMGLNQGGVKKIVICESLIQIMLGVLIGVAVLFLLQPVILSLIESMFASMFSFFEVEYTVSVTIPFYLPLVTAVVFFLFASLFSRGSLGKIARQDVISTISEVA